MHVLQNKSPSGPVMKETSDKNGSDSVMQIFAQITLDSIQQEHKAQANFVPADDIISCLTRTDATTT